MIANEITGYILLFFSGSLFTYFFAIRPLSLKVYYGKKEFDKIVEEKASLTIKNPVKAIAFSKIAEAAKECDPSLNVFLNIPSSVYGYKKRFLIPFVIVAKNSSPIMFVFLEDPEMEEGELKTETVVLKNRKDYVKLKWKLCSVMQNFFRSSRSGA